MEMGWAPSQGNFSVCPAVSFPGLSQILTLREPLAPKLHASLCFLGIQPGSLLHPQRRARDPRERGTALSAFPGQPPEQTDACLLSCTVPLWRNARKGPGPPCSSTSAVVFRYCPSSFFPGHSVLATLPQHVSCSPPAHLRSRCLPWLMLCGDAN